MKPTKRVLKDESAAEPVIEKDDEACPKHGAECPGYHEESDEGDSEEKTYKDVATRLDSIDANMGKMVEVLKGLDQNQHRLAKRLATMEKAVPPEDDVEWPSGQDKGGVDHDPTKEEAENHPSPEGSSKPTKSTLDTGGSFTGKKGAKEEPVIDEAFMKSETFQKALESKVVEVVKANVPLPYGWVDNDDARLAIKSPIQFAMKFLALDRATSGHGMKGFKRGTPEDHVKVQREVFKALGMNYAVGGVN